ncbi:MAG: class I SAM-dependent methyltransferase [Dehalococcoidales bacterium]|nr:class I SAM-dependent methyltransferase [Dehalococcoidales bacterium]
MGSFISFIPTPFEVIDTFFKLAPISDTDVVYDLGSGDGRLLFSALERGAGKIVGIELEPALANDANKKAEEEGLTNKATFLEADVMDVDLSDATVVLCYLFPTASEALKPKLESELKPGTRVVMESFPIDGWSPAKTDTFGYKTFYLYVMPPVACEKGKQDPTTYV